MVNNEPIQLTRKFKVPSGETEESFLARLCNQGLKDRYDQAASIAAHRLKCELKVIEKNGLAGYFLMMWDIVNYAKRISVGVGP